MEYYAADENDGYNDPFQRREQNIVTQYNHLKETRLENIFQTDSNGCR